MVSGFPLSRYKYVILTSFTLVHVFFIVMKLRRRRYFIELAAQLLQRALEEGHADYVLKWGQSILDFLCRSLFFFLIDELIENIDVMDL